MVDMDKGLLCKLSYVNRISVPVYRGRTPLSHAEIEVRATFTYYSRGVCTESTINM